jgi:hypothetical protein
MFYSAFIPTFLKRVPYLPVFLLVVLQQQMAPGGIATVHREISLKPRRNGEISFALRTQVMVALAHAYRFGMALQMKP